MELKYQICLVIDASTEGFNRTFMELKYNRVKDCPTGYAVLIVPLWNWNKFVVKFQNGLYCFNRTFMELKYADFCREFSDDEF